MSHTAQSPIPKNGIWMLPARLPQGLLINSALPQDADFMVFPSITPALFTIYNGAHAMWFLLRRQQISLMDSLRALTPYSWIRLTQVVVMVIGICCAGVRLFSTDMTALLLCHLGGFLIGIVVTILELAIDLLQVTHTIFFLQKLKTIEHTDTQDYRVTAFVTAYCTTTQIASPSMLEIYEKKQCLKNIIGKLALEKFEEELLYKKGEFYLTTKALELIERQAWKNLLSALLGVIINLAIMIGGGLIHLYPLFSGFVIHGISNLFAWIRYFVFQELRAHESWSLNHNFWIPRSIRDFFARQGSIVLA